MAILSPPVVSSGIFTMSQGAMVAEISDLGPTFQMGRVYDDACDEGLTVRSERTGKLVVFAVSRRVEREGEVLAWELESVTPGARGHKMVLFND
jgi:hypothetical protein